MKKVIGCLVTITLLTGMAAVAQQREPEIDKVVEQYQAAFNKGDAKTLAAIYAEDAIRVGIDGTPLVGRAAIQSSFETHFAGDWKGTRLSLTPGRSQSVTTDVRVQEGTFEVTGGKQGPVRGRYLITLARLGGEWKVAGLAAFPSAPAQ